MIVWLPMVGCPNMKGFEMIATMEALNQPRWKKGWGTRNGFWYLFHEGRKVSLTKYGSPRSCTGKRGTKKERQQALQAKENYLSALATDTTSSDKVLTVGDVVAPYIKKHAPTCSNQKQILRVLHVFLYGRRKALRGCLPFAGVGAALPWEKLTMKHFEKWEASHPNWSASTRSDNYKILMAAFNYAMSVDGGNLIGASPLKGMKLKRNDAQRECFTDKEEKLLIANMDQSLLAWFQAAVATGARPMELGNATTAHVQKSKSGRLMIVLPPHLWKCGKKTGKQRFIPLPKDIENYVAEKMKEAKRNNKVLLLWSNDGNEWTSNSISQAFKKVVDDLVAAGKKINPKLSSYSTRHTFINRALVRGVSIAVLAKVCGTSVGMIEKHYSHLAQEHDILQAVVDN